MPPFIFEDLGMKKHLMNNFMYGLDQSIQR